MYDIWCQSLPWSVKRIYLINIGKGALLKPTKYFLKDWVKCYEN
jgi:hypothetical protein